MGRKKVNMSQRQVSKDFRKKRLQKEVMVVMVIYKTNKTAENKCLYQKK